MDIMQFLKFYIYSLTATKILFHLAEISQRQTTKVVIFLCQIESTPEISHLEKNVLSEKKTQIISHAKLYFK